MKKTLNQVYQWIDARMPIGKTMREHLTEYYAPKNFNFWYYFGSLALFVLVLQIATGIFLTMFYTPRAEHAFASVEFIMRDVNWGWLIRYLHSTGASFFFIVVYLHMFKALMYGSSKKPRELLWLIGMMIFMALLAEAFFGYLLPWGQMSFWGAQVITSLFGAIPWVGDSLALWIRGDYNISDATLNRYFALHVIAIPMLLLGLAYLHIIALHKVGSNNPDGIEIKDHKGADGNPVDGIPFHPYYTVKDIFGFFVFLFIFCTVLFYLPEMKGYFLEYANFQPANPFATPEHIAPVWYMTPFYAILRAIPNKLLGVLSMLGAIVILFFLPWLDRSPVRSIRYRGPLTKIALTLFVISFFGLGYLGTVSVTPLRQLMAQVFSAVYFLFFLLMPIYTKFEVCKNVPERLK